MQDVEHEPKRPIPTTSLLLSPGIVCDAAGQVGILLTA